MATTTTAVACCFLFGVFTFVSSVQGSGTIYVSLLSYETTNDVIKTCCDLVGGSDGRCEEDNMCGLSFYISLSTLDNVNSVLLPAPLSWKPGTLTPTVFEINGWTGGPTILGLELVLGDLMSGGQLIDSAQAGLTIDGPSDFYSSLTVRTDKGAVAQVMYRLACDTNYTGEGCATNCLDQPYSMECSAQTGQNLAPVSNTIIYDQALQYFGSPLARCPGPSQKPNSTVSPSDSVIPSILPTTSSSPPVSPSKTTTTDDVSATTISNTITLVSDTSLPVMPTRVMASSTPDVSPTPLLYTSSSPTTHVIASTAKSLTTSLTQRQSSPTILVSELPTLTTSTQLLPTATTSLTRTTLSTPTTISATPTQPVDQTTVTVPVLPATLPVVQYTSTDPSREPITSRPSLTIPEFPATTALAQTSDTPMRYWAAIVGGVVGGLAVIAVLGFLLYRSRQRTLQKRQEIYTVTPQSISSIEENGTSGRSDVPMTTALL